MNKQCDFCTREYIVNTLNAERFCKRRIDRYTDKKCKYSLAILKTYVKLSLPLELYIKNKHPAIFEKCTLRFSSSTEDARKIASSSFLNSQPSAIHSTLIKCNFCNLDACDFHLQHAFTCTRCSCDTPFAICGWCQDINGNKKWCTKCYKENCFRFLARCTWCNDTNNYNELCILCKTHKDNVNTLTDLHMLKVVASYSDASSLPVITASPEYGNPLYQDVTDKHRHNDVFAELFDDNDEELLYIDTGTVTSSNGSSFQGPLSLPLQGPLSLPLDLSESSLSYSYRQNNDLGTDIQFRMDTLDNLDKYLQNTNFVARSELPIPIPNTNRSHTDGFFCDEGFRPLFMGKSLLEPNQGYPMDMDVDDDDDYYYRTNCD